MDNNENKFNFSEEQALKNQEVVKESKEAVKKDVKGLFSSIVTYMSNLLDFREDTDREATVNAIKGDIPFRGATAWILVCSIFVASIGLNANSTAVVIGAMLISPLMGPILGVGLSNVAANQEEIYKLIHDYPQYTFIINSSPLPKSKITLRPSCEATLIKSSKLLMPSTLIAISSPAMEKRRP